MEKHDVCPECGKSFMGRTHRLKITVARLFGMLLPTSAGEVPGVVLFGVRCPGCNTIFQSRELRYFGWLGYPSYLVLLFALLVSLMGITLFVWSR